MISLKIDVTKIDKSRLFVGKKGTYLNAVLIETPNSEHSDYVIVEDISYEERQSGKKGTILGNGKIIVRRDPSEHNNPPDATINDGDFDPPF